MPLASRARADAGIAHPSAHSRAQGDTRDARALARGGGVPCDGVDVTGCDKVPKVPGQLGVQTPTANTTANTHCQTHPLPTPRGVICSTLPPGSLVAGIGVPRRRRWRQVHNYPPTSPTPPLSRQNGVPVCLCADTHSHASSSSWEAARSAQAAAVGSEATQCSINLRLERP